MRIRGPIITLLAVAALAAVLVVVNMTVTSHTASQDTGTAPPPATSSPTTTPPKVAPEQTTYAGRTSGNEVTIAIASRNGQAAAYVCDGHRVEAWLQGTITDGRLTVQGAHEARATGVIEGNALFGTVWVNGKQWPYSARLASPPAGLYQGSVTVNGTPNRIG